MSDVLSPRLGLIRESLPSPQAAEARKKDLRGSREPASLGVRCRAAHGEDSMSRNSVMVLVVAIGLCAPASTFAQLVPPAGSAGAGNAPISGVPYGPANPRSLSDPSGIGNAGSTSASPMIRPSPPPPAVSTNTVTSPRVRATTPYAGASQRIVSPRAGPRKSPAGRRGRPEVSRFTGICRGC